MRVQTLPGLQGTGVTTPYLILTSLVGCLISGFSLHMHQRFLARADYQPFCFGFPPRSCSSLYAHPSTVLYYVPFEAFALILFATAAMAAVLDPRNGTGTRAVINVSTVAAIGLLLYTVGNVWLSDHVLALYGVMLLCCGMVQLVLAAWTHGARDGQTRRTLTWPVRAICWGLLATMGGVILSSARVAWTRYTLIEDDGFPKNVKLITQPRGGKSYGDARAAEENWIARRRLLPVAPSIAGFPIVVFTDLTCLSCNAWVNRIDERVQGLGASFKAGTIQVRDAAVSGRCRSQHAAQPHCDLAILMHAARRSGTSTALLLWLIAAPGDVSGEMVQEARDRFTGRAITADEMATYAQQVAEDQRLADELSIRSVPVTFFNGARVEGLLPPEVLAAAVRVELRNPLRR